MNSYADNITASLENSRNCLRRIARNDDTEFSHQSILNVMEKFVKNVNAMDETILVPCRLMDLKVGDENDPTMRPNNNSSSSNNKKHNPKNKQDLLESLNAVDLFQVYNLLNKMKADLLWGQGQELEESVMEEPVAVAVAVAVPATPVTGNPGAPKKGHVRRPSTVSVASTNSSTSTISDSESDAGNENDSGIEEGQEVFADRVDQVSKNFRKHLVGLTHSMKQMTDVARYLTSRYQHDIGGPV